MESCRRRATISSVLPLTTESVTLGLSLRKLPSIRGKIYCATVVEAGLGLGFVSEWAISKALRLATVVTIRIENLDIRRELTLIRKLGPAPEGPAAVFHRFALAQNPPTQEAGKGPPSRR